MRGLTVFSLGVFGGFGLCWILNYFFFLREFPSSPSVVEVANASASVRYGRSDLPSEAADSDKETPKKMDASLVIHTYHEGKLFPAYEVMMDSYLVTQDLRTTKFVQWTDEDWATSDDNYKRWISQRYRECPNIEFKQVELQALTKDTCFAEREEFLSRESMAKYGLRDWSNVIRILLLFHYGGVWIDSDTILLFDLLHIHRLNSNAITAGYAPDNKDRSNKESGFFNNNFLMATDLSVRQAFVRAACEFRRKPLGVDKKGNRQFVNVVPLMGEDQHELSVMNHWLFNDGALKICNIREDCNLVWIGLGETDPGWLRTLDMYSMCERMRSSFGAYTHSFEELLRLKGWRDSNDYLGSRDWKQNIWMIHTRAAHCRSRTRPMGMLDYASTAIRQRMAFDPTKAPIQPVDFMSYDLMNEKLQDNVVAFYNVGIVVNSAGSDFVQRQTLRGIINNPIWLRYIGASVSGQHKLFFIVNYDKSPKNNAIGALQEEQQTYGDLLLVDYIADEKDGYTKHNASVNESVRRALLKLLNRYEFRYYVVLNKTTIFIDMRNLWLLLDEASGNRTLNKERGIQSFLLSHRPDNKDVRDNLAAGGLSDFNVVSVDAMPDFILFTRSNLPVVLGLPSLSPDFEKQNTDQPSPKAEVRLGSADETASNNTAVKSEGGEKAKPPVDGGEESMVVYVDPEDPSEYDLTEVPNTVVEAVRRVPLSVHQTAFPCGVERASVWRAQLCANVTDTLPFGKSVDFAEFASASPLVQLVKDFSFCSSDSNQTSGRPLLNGTPGNGVTFVRNVPCAAAMYALLSESVGVERDGAYTKLFA